MNAARGGHHDATTRALFAPLDNAPPLLAPPDDAPLLLAPLDDAPPLLEPLGEQLSASLLVMPVWRALYSYSFGRRG